MSAITASLARVPNYLTSQLSLARLTQTNKDLLRVSEQLSTGKAINRPSDDPIRSATLNIIDQRLSDAQQRLRNLDHARGNLDILESSLGEASDLVLRAQKIALEEVGSLASGEERRLVATEIESLIGQLTNIANREGIAGFLFGGSRAGTQPVDSIFGGYRYNGSDTGLFTDIGIDSRVPITLPANNPIGAFSERVVGTVALTPSLHADARIEDLDGARNLGVSLGVIEVRVNGQPPAEIDLTGADTIQDVADTLERALADYGVSAGIPVLGAGGVQVAGNGLLLSIDPSATVTFSDPDGGTTGADLGLVTDPATLFTNGAPLAGFPNPKLTPLTPISAIPGLTLGQVEIQNLGRSEIVDLSGAQTFQDVISAFESTGLGIRAELDPTGHRLIVRNETAAGRDQSLSISEVGGGTTAADLGIRTFGFGTPVSDLNFGTGVRIADGGTDPVTGLPDPALDVDFNIVLGDGRTITVDLRPQDMTDVQAVVDRINSEITAQSGALLLAPGDVVAGIGGDDNGLTITVNPAIAAMGPVSFERDNNSLAAGDLGLLDGQWDAASGVYLGSDRSKVQVDNLYSALIDLRDALLGDDQFGIEIAGNRLDGFVERIAQSRALVGGYVNRVDQVATDTENRVLLDEQTRSSFADLDFAAASTEFSQLQVQLQAGLQATALSRQLSLLDFLG